MQKREREGDRGRGGREREKEGEKAKKKIDRDDHFSHLSSLSSKFVIILCPHSVSFLSYNPDLAGRTQIMF